MEKSLRVAIIMLTIWSSKIDANCQPPNAVPDIDLSSTPKPTSNFDSCTEEVVRELSDHADAKSEYMDYLSNTTLGARIEFAKAYVGWLRLRTMNTVWDYPVPRYFVPYPSQIDWARTWWQQGGRTPAGQTHERTKEISKEWLREALLFADQTMFVVGARATGRPRFTYLGQDHDTFRAVLLERIDSPDALLDYLHLQKIQSSTEDVPQGGIGLILQGHVIHKVVPDSPAFEAGILPGDVIIAVDELPVAGLGDLVLKIRGAVGSVVKLIIARGDTRHSYTLTRKDSKQFETGHHN